ncbi:5' nucleotidase, NT5C type [Bacteroides thetaiotaomicron]|uniref:5' nucleotidase, NT5C type n=1 Tax=Bacteroides thetaiotaomicron TaxID=818 RepID=UPI0040629579
MKKILYIDMDNVLVDFQSGIDSLSEAERVEFMGKYDEVPGIFAAMQPLPGAVDSFRKLCEYYNVYILSTAPWKNPSAWSDKLIWVRKNIGKNAYKRLILTHHKNLAKGDYLIDDRTKNGAAEFEGELILFGSEQFPNWNTIVDYLVSKVQNTNLRAAEDKYFIDMFGLDEFQKLEELQQDKTSLKHTIISPLQENAFTEHVIHKEVLSKIDFDLPDNVWNEINEGFAHFWNVEVGQGNDVYFNDACNSIDDHLKRKRLIFQFNNLVRIVEIMFDFIEKIPGAFLDDE